MKTKMKLFSVIFLLSLILYSCGGTGGGSSSSTTTGFNYNTAPVRIAFDPNNSAIPLPNDANSTLLAGDNSTLKLTIDPNAPADIQALYSAINALKLKGLPANTFLTIPLNVNEPLDITSLYQNIFLIPFKTGVVSTANGVVPLAGPENLIIKQKGNVIKILFKKPLLSNAQYAVVIKKGIKTEDGELVGHDPAMELVIEQYSQLITMLGLNSNDILTILSFTTANKTLKLSAFAKLALGMPFNDNDTLSYDNITGEFKEIVGATSLLSSLSSVDNETSLSVNGINILKTSFNSFDITKLNDNITELLSKDKLSVPVIIIPNGVTTNKVVIFQHGLGGDKTHAFAIAQKFLQAGYPIISMDLPWHGERVGDNASIYDCNHDGVISSGECFLTANLVQDRINFYQSVFDLTMLLKDLKAGKFDINGDNVTDNVTDVYYVALSLGSMTGSMFATYNVNDLKKIALTVGGADLSTILDGTAITSLQAAIAALGLQKGTPEYYTFLGLLHLILDPGDMLYNVNSSIKNKTMVISAYGDNIVPNTSNEILANLIGYSVPTVVTSFDNISPSAGWYQYGGIVNGTPEYVPHAFLLSVDNASAKYGINFDDNFISEAHDKVQAQIINFFNN